MESDILATGPLRSKPVKPKKADDESQQYVESKQSKKILRMARELAADEEATSDATANKSIPDAFSFDSREEYREPEVVDEVADDGSEWGDDDQEPEVEDVAPEDLEVFNKFLPPAGDDALLRHGWGGKRNGAEDSKPGINIADLILQRIAEHEAANERVEMREKGIAPPDEDEEELSEKVVEVFTQ